MEDSPHDRGAGNGIPLPDSTPARRDTPIEEQSLTQRLAATMRVVGWFVVVAGVSELLGALAGDMTSLLLGLVLLSVGRATLRSARAFRHYSLDGATDADLRIRALGELVQVYRTQYVGAWMLVGMFVVLLGIAVVWRTFAASSVGVEQLTETVDVLETLGEKAFALQFTGGPVACWVDVEADGVKQQMNLWSDRPEERSHESGLVSTFIWTREEVEPAGTERWRMGRRSGVCDFPPLSIDNLLPGKRDRARDNEERCSWGTQTGDKTIELGVRHTGSSGSTRESTTIRSPMPAGKDVTMRTITEEWQDGSEVYHTHVLRVVCYTPKG